MSKKIIAFILMLCIAFSAFSISASADFEIASEIKSAILIEPKTGTVIYEKNADEKLPPASVTKTMTALLVMEAIESGKLSFDSQITVSAAASGMGGSQIFLEVGEQIKVSELLEGMMVASGNDAAVAFAEAIGGTEENFVSMMNKRAEELGLQNTHFMNCHGLDEENHYTSARDIAIISAELVKHEDILHYTSIWTDTIRDGRTALANTNKLVRFYDGCDGLKTGSTSIARCCITATAKKNGLRLIAVVLAAPTTDMRFAAARQLFDYGFAVKEFAEIKEEKLDMLPVKAGVKNKVAVRFDSSSMLVEKGTAAKIKYETVIPEYLNAPVKKGDKVGKISAVLDGKELFHSDIVATESVEKVGVLQIFLNILKNICGR